ncbi:uncharacterized protein K452DRAFT_321718 [Aplosporella prunicola CBS 121167]|uniref:Enoyl reductase (ER) domain-containing protein n=1 Tax=Aplosporella prunicola CBS 121167 TaxID=1176127 RepID=A0A6A6B0T4_9PEZI|nr:uncharacterized protein K452DRAFT_321718 [Aplosporella prunicola CBS 121167]KAF2137466.1 hypothetical protein K452DRAFT_321718 [Aplosporella prunicola CBS 121167]
MTEQNHARAIVARGPLGEGGWKMEDVRLREIADDELVIRVVASGICHTDIITGSQKEGPGVVYPSVKGHEGSGYVERVGAAVTVAQPGDPVLLSFSYCADCAICESGHPAYCTRFGEINFVGAPNFSSATTLPNEQADLFGGFFGQSSFASKTIVKQNSVVNVKGLVADDDLKMLCSLGCGVQTGSGSITNLAEAGPTDTVAVMGVGAVGLSSIMGAKLQGCQTIIGIDKVASRLELAKELGATHTINTAGMKDLSEVVNAVLDVTDGLGSSVTVDTTGFVPLISKGVEFTRMRGKLIQVGLPAFDATLSIPITMFIITGKQYIGSMEGDVVPSEYIPKLLQWYGDSKLPLEKMTRFYKADEWQKAIDDTHHGDAVKAVIVW